MCVFWLCSSFRLTATVLCGLRWIQTLGITTTLMHSLVRNKIIFSFFLKCGVLCVCLSLIISFPLSWSIQLVQWTELQECLVCSVCPASWTGCPLWTQELQWEWGTWSLSLRLEVILSAVLQTVPATDQSTTSCERERDTGSLLPQNALQNLNIRHSNCMFILDNFLMLSDANKNVVISNLL